MTGRPQPGRRHGRLLPMTDRRRRILIHVANGLPNREIATVMNISPDTVNGHLQHIYAFLGARDRANAVALAALAWHLAIGTHAWIVGLAAATGIALTLTPDRWKQRRRSR